MVRRDGPTTFSSLRSNRARLVPTCFARLAKWGAGGPRVEAARSALSRRPVTGLDQGQEPKSSGDGAGEGRVRMTTVDDRMPTKDLEVEVREPAWSHQGSLGSARATGALVRDVRGRCSAHGCTWVSQAVSRAAGAHFIRRVGTSAIWSLSDEKRT
jgi:hypothetical protein